jgi:uncharacterized protein
MLWGHFGVKRESNVKPLSDEAKQISEMTLEELLSSGNGGSLEAAHQLSLAFSSSSKDYGVERDLEKSIMWLKKSCESNNPQWEYELGDCYWNRAFDGDVKANANEAIRWLEKSADQGNVNAEKELSDIYEDGENGIRRNAKKSFSWKLKAAEQGEGWAMVLVGCAYNWGLGTEQDSAKALEWYEKSSESNDRYSFTSARNAGLLLLKGEGIEQNISKAIDWLRIAKKHAERDNDKFELDLIEKNIGLAQAFLYASLR